MLDFLVSRSDGSYLEMAHITKGDQNVLFITVEDISPEAQSWESSRLYKRTL